MSLVLTMISSLKVLASSADDQLEYLRRLGIPAVIDELALQFDDVALTAQSLLDRGDIDDRQCNAINALLALLGTMSSRPGLWTPEELRTATEWQDVRRQASDALELFHQRP